MILLAVLALLLPAPASAAPQLAKVADFSQPTYATTPPGDPTRIFVTERSGRVRLVVDGVPQTQPFLDLSGITQSGYEEQGLLSIAFAPDYAASGRFYVYLTATAAAAASGTDGEIQIREYRRSAANPNAADPATARLLLSIRHTDAQNHDGGQLQFGPDGMLWAGTGDGGGGNDQYHHSQDPASLLGKLFRLDTSQAAPAPDVRSRGLRNPWRFSFDRQTGQIVIGDVGQDQIEEIDAGLADNYGWPCKEGTRDNVSDPGCAGVATAPPVLERTHSDGFCAIVGGYVVRDPGLPTLLGRYIYGDNCNRTLWSVNLAAVGDDSATGLTVDGLSSFGEDSCGRILVVSLGGPVYRLIDGTPSPCTPTGGPPAASGPADRRACRLKLRVTGLRSVRRRRRLSAALRTDEACRATLSARVRGVARFRTAHRSLAPSKRTVVTLRLTRRGAARIRRALRRHRWLRLSVRVQAVDGAGNVRTLARGARLRG